MRTYIILGAAALALFGCSKEAPAPAETAPPASQAAAEPSASEKLDTVLAAQSEQDKARYPHRHPKETLEFFGIEPGMTVVDTIPGDDYRFNETTRKIVGQRTRREYSIGERVHVVLDRVDAMERKLTFALVETVRSGKRRRNRS